MIRKIGFLAGLTWWAAAVCFGQDATSWQTAYERSNFLETGTYDEDLEFCKRLAEASSFVELDTFGMSPEGRALPLLTIDLSPQNNPDNEPVLFIEAGIHAGEIDGKDAGLLFFRDAIIDKKYGTLLNGVRIYFVPIFNVDGHERRSKFNRANQLGPVEQGFRTTAQNLNLNRDWLKADAPEMRAMVALLDSLHPDFLVDLHTTDGADYQYVISYSLNMDENEQPAIRDYLRRSFLPVMQMRMSAAGFDFVPYIVTRGGSLESGWVSGISPPRFSTGYGTLINRPFMLIETHSLKTHKERVDAVVAYLKDLVYAINSTRGPLLDAVGKSDRTAQELAGKPYSLNWTMAPDSQMVNFRGVESELAWNPVIADSIVHWGDTPKNLTIPFYEKHIAKDTITVPYGYVIPRPWLLKVQDVLDAHGVGYALTKAPLEIEIESYRFSKVKFAEKPFEGRIGVSFETTPIVQKLDLPAGSALITTAQAKSQIAIHLLEPGGPDSFVKWGFFNAIFEQKEYAADYVMDTVVTRLLEQQPNLRAEFEAKLAADSAFAASPAERSQFFYERSEYWDMRKDIYPIGRVVDKTAWSISAKAAGIN